MKKIIITRTIQEVVENPNSVLVNLQNTLSALVSEKKRIKALEAEILDNMRLILIEIKGFVVKISEGGEKKSILNIKGLGELEIDVERGDRVFPNKEEAELYIKQLEEDRG